MAVGSHPANEIAHRSRAHPKATSRWGRALRWALLAGFAATLGVEAWLLWRAWQLWYPR